MSQKHHRHQTKKVNTALFNLYALITLVLIFIISTIAVFYYYKRLPLTPKEEKPAISEKKPSVLNQTITYFYTNIFLQKNKTFVSVPYKFDTPQPAYIYLQGKDDTFTQTRIITHPFLINLNWPKISDGEITLYQRNKTYKSMADFLRSLPPENKIAYDPGVLQNAKYTNVQGKPLLEVSTLDELDYLITTYTPPREENGLYYYEHIFDATNALVNVKQQLVWIIKTPNASADTPFYLGEIHVDYR